VNQLCLPASDGILSGRGAPTRAYVVLKPCLIFLLRLCNSPGVGMISEDVVSGIVVNASARLSVRLGVGVRDLLFQG